MTSPEEKRYSNYLSQSPSPSGVKAIFTYLESEKNSVEKWSQSPEMLPNKAENQILIMVGPYFIPDQEEMEAYQSFMEAGNTILLFKESPKGMFDVRTAPLEESVATDEEVTVVTDGEGKAHKAEIGSSIRLKANEKDEILIKDESGIIAFKRAFGKGQLIVSNSPNWMTNGSILEQDHLSLVVSFINESKADSILFDEYSHGQENASKIGTLYPKWFLIFIVQGTLIIVMWLLLKGKRFGPILVSRKETVRFSDERIKALAAWYIRGKRYQDSLFIQADYVKLLMQEKWGIAYGKEWKDISPQLERKWKGLPASEITSFLEGLKNVLAKRKINKKEYLLWSKKLDRLRKEVEEG
jgi:Domain of unknown function (DUF4350)